MKQVFLSHFIDAQTPLYGGEGGICVERVRSMDAGDSCNTLRIDMPCHAGTHVDLPLHFSSTGRALDGFLAEQWVFETVGLLVLPNIEPCQSLGPALLLDVNLPKEMDLLLINTGFGRRRDETVYWKEGPIFEASLADALREKFPRLRAMGMDTISLSSWSDRTQGRQAHRAFLEGDRPILLIEDMDLSPLRESVHIQRVVAAPLMIRHADGVPCTIIAEVVQ